MLSVFLTFAGICLCINGVRLYQSASSVIEKHISEKDAAIVNLFTGVLGLVVINTMIQTSGMVVIDYSSAAYVGLFALTYVWIGVNAYTGSDGKALGWFSLLVSGIAVPTAWITLHNAQTVFDHWLAVSWLSWAVLWFMFFLMLVQKKKITKFAGLMSMVQGVGTALLPALLNF